MRGRDGVVRVAAELFGGEFPVAGDDPLLHTRDGIGAGLGTVEHVVPVELRLAQIGVQIRGVVVPVGEDRSEAHTSEPRSQMHISYSVFYLKKNTLSRRDF